MQTNFPNGKRILWLPLFFFTFLTLHSKAQTSNSTGDVNVYHIQNYFSEAYLVKGPNKKLILIETGVSVAGYQDSLVSSIKKLGFNPDDIALAVVTHGHGDHAGNARFLQQTYHIPIAGSKADLVKFTTGKTELSKCEDVSIWGSRLRPYSDLPYQPFTPEILVEKVTIELDKYGMKGKLIPIAGGHTPGDLLILIGPNLFVGDAFLGTFKAHGGGLAPDGHQVREHFYHENKQLADQNLKLIEKIALENNVKTLYPTHNGPVSIHALTKYIQEEPLLKTLTKQETALLDDVVKGKTDLHQKYLSDNFILQTTENQFTKTEFMDHYINNPKAKIESIVAEDFRIVNSDKNTAVLTYLETIKLAGKDPRTVSILETYSKLNNDWKLTYKRSVE